MPKQEIDKSIEEAEYEAWCRVKREWKNSVDAALEETNRVANASFPPTTMHYVRKKLYIDKIAIEREKIQVTGFDNRIKRVKSI